MRTAGRAPFRYYSPGPIPEDVDPTQVILVEVSLREDNQVHLHLPQFGIDCSAEYDDDEAALATLIDQMAKRLLGFYRALTEVPDSYITEIEEEQIELLQDLVLPWVGVQLATSPSYWALPESAAQPAEAYIANTREAAAV